ncbi:MAG: PriCT-2 domain-containing protein, partial [Gammaproteobacteria bacterium]
RDEEHEPSIEETELSKLVLGDGFTLDPDCSREEWLNAGMAMHEASAGANWGLAIFDAWSARGEKYAGDADTIGRWESFVDGKSGNVGIGFLKQHTRATVANFGPPLSAEQHARIDAEIAAARKGRPTIELRSGDLHHYVKRCEDVLARELFVLNQELVKIGATPDLIGLRDTDGVERDDKQLVIIPIGIEFIIRYLGEHVHFQKFDARSKEMVDKDCPRALAQNIAQGPEWPTMRPLRAIAAAPFLRADTTVCDAPGYDARSAVFYGPNGTFPPIPESPSQKDAAIALATLLAPFSEFPFAEPVHQAAFVAHILTEAVRPALDHAPLFCYTAPLAATGKSLLSGMPSRIVHGCAPALHTWTEDSDELRKVLFASLRVGDRTIGFDNLPNGGVVRAAELCKFITEEAHEGRVLGSSIVSKLPNKSVVFLTGNNITPAGDLARRSVVIRLDANTDSGGLRVRQFKIVDLARHIDANRGALLAAALTIVRAFVVAGSPKQGVIPLPSFERWSALVRDPLMWLGLADPASGQDDDTDDEQEPVGAAFAQMAARFAGRRFTSKELAVLCGVETETSGLRSALIEAGCAQPEDATELREWLRGVRLRVADGQKLVTWRTNANRGWQLVTVGRDRLQEDRDADVIG